MKRIAAFGIAMLLAGCGNTSVDNEVVGQAKKMMNKTNLICLDYKVLDISLGVVRGGTGSMSTEDLFLVVTIKKAVDAGSLVKVHYNVRRVHPCSEGNWLTSIEIAQ